MTRIKPDPRVPRWLQAANDNLLYLSVISIGEFCKGFTVHPEQHRRAGTKNSAVRVGVAGVDGGAPRWMQVPGDPRNHYIFRVDWVENGSGLAIGQLNRKQNTATVFIADPQSGAAKAVFSDRDDAWVDVPESGGPGRESGGFDWLNNGKRFLWLSERDGWRHAYSISRDGGEPVPITSEAADVIGIEAIDPDSRWIYFLAAPGNATQRYLYRSAVDQPGPAVRLSPVEQPGTHFYRISPNCQWAFHTYSRFDRPPVTDLLSLPDHKSVRTLEDNSVLRANVASSVEPQVEFLQLSLADGATLDGWLLKPRVFDPSKKYPLLVHVYGGRRALPSWTRGWETALCFTGHWPTMAI